MLGYFAGHGRAALRGVRLLRGVRALLCGFAGLDAKNAALGADDVGATPTKDVKSADLWRVLYEKLAELCVDSRSEVRKSASQTLFSTVATHGWLLDTETWHH